MRKNRQQFWASVTLTPLYDDGGRLKGFAKVTRDITEYRRAQEARIRLERAEEALELRDQFLGEAKRSLNLILATIRIHVEALKNTVEPVRGETAAGVSPAEDARVGLDRLCNMIEDVLRMAVEAGDKLLRDLEQRDR